ncbi:RWD domain-containing protein 3 isoform X4 [Saccopteryx leptura]|uniref:RWD domain-containing protein 3 isoform X4 n=1 Tax=Saccopteryx leptura TaxID=249018 RepID=UPI00339C147C
MAGSAREELSALAAIFCGPGEWEVLSCSETDGAVFRILTEARGLTEADVPLELVFHLPVGYPSCLPGISVRSERLTRAQRAAVREALLEQARSLLSEPMVHQLVLWAQQNLRHILAQPGSGGGPGEGPSEAPSGSGDEGPWLALLHLDHMRAKTRYVRAVRQWASALGLTGRLLFAGVPGASENLQGRRGLEWTEVQRENGQRAVRKEGAARRHEVSGIRSQGVLLAGRVTEGV